MGDKMGELYAQPFSFGITANKEPKDPYSKRDEALWEKVQKGSVFKKDDG